MMNETNVSCKDILDDETKLKAKRLAWQLAQLKVAGFDKNDDDGGGGAGGEPELEYTWAESNKDDYEPDF